ncbi:GDSL-type esterase/lipase family protein [Devosia sp. 2618]|uniref:GDSL-type esterase/lipase family protein n=1 Tax=Devosia sp. 2618 TaxID=3156454 RepID=UPI0033973443
MTNWIATPITQALLRGVIDLEHTPTGLVPHRLPAWARAQWPDPQLLMAEGQPSGIRLAFPTDATAIELDTIPTKRVYTGLPPRPDGIYDLLIDGQLTQQASVAGGKVMEINMTNGSVTVNSGPPGTLKFNDLPQGPKDVEIWLPHNETTELVALRTNAPITPAPYTDRRVWLHHGSSISHGSNAEHPTGIWPAIAARASGVDLVSLGFGGSAVVDPFTARTIRDASADLISLKLGINVVNTDAMRLRAFGPAVHGFLDTIREGHKTTPILVLSPILCPIHEDTPGPSAPDFSTGQMQFRATGNPAEVAAGKLTLNVIRTTLERTVEQRRASDPNIHYLDGRALYGEADAATLPLPDGLHPDAATHRLMGERFAELAFGSGWSA